jgi:predicted GNAT family N-acyltransferase
MEIKELEFGSSDYKESIKLRDEVLRKPLGLEYSEDFLNSEKDQHHIGFFKNGEIVGILLLQNLGGGEIKMRQVAVKEEMRKNGIGRRLVEYSEKISAEMGYSKIVLHSRKTAVGFYEKMGYGIVGEEFIEVGIPHYKMEKILKKI